jgi:hypothetical protein
MLNKKQKAVEQLKEQADVKTAIKQTGTQEESDRPVADTRDKAWFGGFSALLLELAPSRAGLSVEIGSRPKARTVRDPVVEGPSQSGSVYGARPARPSAR